MEPLKVEQAIKQMAIGDIRPQEDRATDDEDPQDVAAQISADVLHRQGAAHPCCKSAGRQCRTQGRQCRPSYIVTANSTLVHGQIYNLHMCKMKMKSHLIHYNQEGW